MLYYYFPDLLSQRKAGNAHDDRTLDDWRRISDRLSQSCAVAF
jgi:uncharacterized protein YdcH (DUF465 family)